jgi:hypothetical protein
LIVIASIPLAISVIGLFCLVPLLCLVAPVGFLVNIFIQQANNALVIEGKGIRDSLQRGWEIVSANLGQFILCRTPSVADETRFALLFGQPVLRYQALVRWTCV